MARLPLWMDEVPTYEVVNGHMQITLGDLVVAMPLNVFLIGCTRGQQAIMQWETSHKDAEVFKFPDSH